MIVLTCSGWLCDDEGLFFNQKLHSQSQDPIPGPPSIPVSPVQLKSKSWSDMDRTFLILHIRSGRGDH